MKLFLYILIFLSAEALFSQAAYIDTVYSFTPGSGQNIGQGEEYFPENIFGRPSAIANEVTAEARPEEILSFGLGGEIVIGIKNKRIINEDGPDFTIFENVFNNDVIDKYFAEPAKVAVSQDGIIWHEFPWDSLSLDGCAGTIPTYGDQDPLDPSVSGGNSFDLDDVNLDWISYIKITDISQMVLDNKQHPYFDITISGFDLDAVACLHTETFVSVEENISDLIVFADKSLKINTDTDTKVAIYDILGTKIEESSNKYIDLSNFKSGRYFLLISIENNVYSKKIYIN